MKILANILIEHKVQLRYRKMAIAGSIKLVSSKTSKFAKPLNHCKQLASTYLSGGAALSGTTKHDGQQEATL